MTDRLYSFYPRYHKHTITIEIVVDDKIEKLLIVNRHNDFIIATSKVCASLTDECKSEIERLYRRVLVSIDEFLEQII